MNRKPLSECGPMIGKVWEWCGGSFLCAKNYCVNDRPSVRRGMDDGTGMSRLGFRCVLFGPATLRTAEKPQNKP